MSGAPLIHGIDAAFLGVTDPQPHLDFYCGQLGYEVADQGAVPAAVADALWGLSGAVSGAVSGDVAVTVLTVAGAAHGRIVLLTVADAAEPEYPHTADYGLIGIDMYTRDIGAAHRALTAAGHRWVSAPATWKVPFGDQVVTVTEGFCLAPEGTDLVFVQPANPRGTAAWDADPSRPYTELTSVVCHVPDLDAELAFWGPDGLGLALWYDTTFSSEGLEQMADLPARTRMRLAFLAGPQTARIELTRIENRSTGIDRRRRQRTAHALGHSGWLVSTGDLDGALARVTERAGTVLAGPLPGAGVLGSGRLASVDTPNGIPLTIQEASR